MSFYPIRLLAKAIDSESIKLGSIPRSGAMKEKVEAKLVELEKENRRTKKRFNKYDNIDDYNRLKELDAMIDLLKELMK